VIERLGRANRLASCPNAYTSGIHCTWDISMTGTSNNIKWRSIAPRKFDKTLSRVILSLSSK
jgi:hypothetical protein